MIGLTTATGDRPHRVTLQNPGPAVSDGEGGYTQTWTDLAPPALWVAIEPATKAALERLAASGTAIIATATHIIRAPYHPQITTKTRVLFNGRVFNVTSLTNPGERNADSLLQVEEIVL